MGRLIAQFARIRVTDRQTHKTSTVTLAAHAPRVNEHNLWEELGYRDKLYGKC